MFFTTWKTQWFRFFTVTTELRGIYLLSFESTRFTVMSKIGHYNMKKFRFKWFTIIINIKLK